MADRIAVYLVGDGSADESIVKGLKQAHCEIVETRTISETIDQIRARQLEPRSGGRSADSAGAWLTVLIADVQAGALPLLILLRDLYNDLPPALLFDRKGDDILTVIRALQLGVREYLLSSDPELHRELRVRLVVERAGAELQRDGEQTPAAPAPVAPPAASPAHQPPDANLPFQWDPVGHVLRIEDDYVRLSPIEGRIFDLLLTNRNRTVPMEELVHRVLTNPTVDIDAGVKQLRPHIVRLRRKLERYPVLANRILNMRGAGYMFI
jgi:DNA-binding response OmpR family regulator